MEEKSHNYVTNAPRCSAGESGPNSYVGNLYIYLCCLSDRQGYCTLVRCHGPMSVHTGAYASVCVCLGISLWVHDSVSGKGTCHEWWHACLCMRVPCVGVALCVRQYNSMGLLAGVCVCVCACICRAGRLAGRLGNMATVLQVSGTNKGRPVPFL